MFGLTAILSASISLLLASQSVIASPKPYTTRSLRLSVRANSEDPDIVPACETPCFKLEDTIDPSHFLAVHVELHINRNNVHPIYHVDVRAMLRLRGEKTARRPSSSSKTPSTVRTSPIRKAFVASCADSDHPVKNITVAAKNTNGGERVAVGMVASFVVGLTAMSLAAL
ncbi:hypothetical protein B0H14DRAFT_2605624 [Mycena olivaceomarginata]|nr:hypothetical protein B0H14DRAFT_2605624 [Mycena olivaceomarginata]